MKSILMVTGKDSHFKNILAVWNIKGFYEGSKGELLAKSVVGFDIQCAKFSPYEDKRILTCGKDSIRFYRLRNGQLRGQSIKLGEHKVFRPGM